MYIYLSAYTACKLRYIHEQKHQTWYKSVCNFLF
uniref:Uncharacterized protein n=1 Tax=Rhizophora mucronata TaxID=61149 RepID=A0A2P2NLS0_RHIMU